MSFTGAIGHGRRQRVTQAATAVRQGARPNCLPIPPSQIGGRTARASTMEMAETASLRSRRATCRRPRPPRPRPIAPSPPPDTHPVPAPPPRPPDRADWLPDSPLQPPPYDPLVLDLDGDGIELVAVD